MADLSGKMFQREGDRLAPADLHAAEFLEGLPQGQRILIDHRSPRHPEHHAAFFAMLTLVCENSEGFSDPENLLDHLKLAVGHTRVAIRARAPDGEEEELAEKLEAFMETSMPPNAAPMFGQMLNYLRRDVEFIHIPGSISFASMSEQDFTRFEKRCLYVIETTMGIDAKALLAETKRVGRRHRR